MATAAKKQTPLPSIFDLDNPTTYYAQSVCDGQILAGPHVRNACARHLRDLESGAERGLAFDVDLANHVIEFFPVVLRLNGGDFEGQPFVPELWQAFIIGSLFGWVHAETGYRRFNTAYVETAKGSGKSPLAAGIGNYCLVSDGEMRAEIYAAATKKDQAMILFRDAVAMVDQSPNLDERIQRSGPKGREWNLAYHATDSFFRPIAADDGQSGPRPHVGLIDEVHEHKHATVIEMMRAGFKFRKQPLLFMITNSGADRQSVCYQYHQYGAQVCAGAREDDAIFAYICALDKGDDPFKDELCWPKANPSLGVTIDYKYLRDQVNAARGMPSKESLVKRLNFCIWTEALSPWIGYETWKAAEEVVDEDLLRGRRCTAGLDMSSTTDLTALVLVFEPTESDPFYRERSWFWLPEIGLLEKADKDRVAYDVWQREGHLLTTPGRAINKFHVLQHLASLTPIYDISALAYDEWRLADIEEVIENEGLQMPPIVPFRQGFKSMAPAVDETERLLIDGKLKHDGNPILTWNAANAVLDTDPAGNRKITKAKATGRVDGMVATVMAIGSLSKLGDGTPPSPWEDENFSLANQG